MKIYNENKKLFPRDLDKRLLKTTYNEKKLTLIVIIYKLFILTKILVLMSFLIILYNL